MFARWRACFHTVTALHKLFSPTAKSFQVMASKEIIEIDGSIKEGGGQILRIAIALSAILRKPVKIYNIRAGRANPGLRPQHLMGIKLVRDLCDGTLEGCEIGSTEVVFYPDHLQAGKYSADTGTAGSVLLLLQVSLPCLLFANASSHLVLKGGTDADMAPPVDYTIKVFQPMIERFGIKLKIDLQKRGFYPKGGGIMTAAVQPLNSIAKIELLERGDVLAITGLSYVAGVLPVKVAYAMADSAVSQLKSHFKNLEINIDCKKLPSDQAFGNGNGIVLVAKTSTGCIFGSTALGSKRISAENVGKNAAVDLIRNLDHGGCVDEHLQDQLIIFMALAEGKSKIKCGPITMHTETAIEIAHIMTKAKFYVREENGTIIECDGQSFKTKA